MASKAPLIRLVLKLLSRRSRPTYSGSVSLAGLDADVEVRFDAYAIPRIKARSEADAWRALGFLHARERLFQMDFTRRAIAGRLAEVLGDEPLAWEGPLGVLRGKAAPC